MGEEVGCGDHFVLVHGASHGAWCWFKLRRLLEDSGRRVSCVDLTGAGINCADPDAVASYDEYDKPLVDLMSALPDGEKVILVGHSAGGLSVIHAMHLFVDKIKLAIFVAATMLPFGFRTEEDKKDGIPNLSEYGDVYVINYGLGVDHPPTSVALRKQFQRKILYQFSPEEDSTLASMLLRPFPTAISSASFAGGGREGGGGAGGERLQQVKRVFIKTMHDNMLKPEQQDAMIRRWPPTDVFTVDADHSPFFSAPNKLFELIVRASLMQ